MKCVVRRWHWLLGLGLAACAAAPAMPDPAPDNPASPEAVEAPRQAPPDTLRIEVAKEPR